MTKKSDDETTAARQGTLPAEGMARKKITALEEVTAAYLKARNKRMAETKKEVQAKQNLLDAMKKHVDKLPRNDEGQAIYAFDDDEGVPQMAVLDEKLNVKVRKVGGEDDE